MTTPSVAETLLQIAYGQGYAKGMKHGFAWGLACCLPVITGLSAMVFS